MAYNELLKDPRWQQKRLEILNRDNWACCKCGETQETLHVHHKYYLAGRLPWDYSGNVLITLCHRCHKEEEDCKEHLNEFVRTLQYWGYFNTDIMKIVNRLIEAKMKQPSNNQLTEPNGEGPGNPLVLE